MIFAIYFENITWAKVSSNSLKKYQKCGEYSTVGEAENKYISK